MISTIETPKDLKIEMVDPRILKYHPKAASIPISEEDKKALKAGIEREGRVHTPLQVNSEFVVLDGVNRGKFAVELKIPKVPVIILHFTSPEEEELHALKANLERRHATEGQRAFLWLDILKIEQNIAEQKKREAQREAAIQQHDRERKQEKEAVMQLFQGGSPHWCGEPPKEKEQNSIKSANNETAEKMAKQSLAKVAEEKSEPNHAAKHNNRENEAAEKIAKQAQVSARTMYQAKAVDKKPELKSAVLAGDISLKSAYTQVQTEKKSQELQEAMQSGKSLTDLEIMQKLSIPVQPYDVWNFPTCDDRFGHDYPGRIPGQLVAHCLYFWTEQGDVVIDPMGGSGTTIDVCKALNRKPLVYDAHPCRDDIMLHNLATQGWPDGTVDAKLIFWDPPYFKKKDDGYGEQSISRFNRSEYLAFFDQMAATIPAGFQGRMAFLMSDYNDEENLQECIWSTDYVNIFTRHNWQIERFIYPPLTTQSIHPDIVNKFRSSKRLARLGRVLVVMGR